MFEQQMNLLNDLGFDTSMKGAKYFLSASDQLQFFLEKIDNDLNNIYDLLPNNIHNIDEYIDSIYVEDYGFYFECGKNIYMEELNKFINSRKIVDDKQRELNERILGNSISDKDILLKISLYLNNEKKNEEKNNEKKLL